MFCLSKSAKVTLVLLLGILLAACAPAQPTVAPEASATPEARPSEASATSEPQPSGGEVLIAFAYTGSATDLGWTYAHDQARLAIEEEFPNVKTEYAEFVPYSEEASRTFEQFIADGAKMIIATTEFDEFLYKVAEAHPDVAFLEVDGAKQSDNVISVFVESGMPYYLVGVAAGLLTESNRLGFVTSFPMPINYTAVNAFQMGAQSVNPDVTTHVVLINSWYDPPSHRQAAEALVNDGADFVMSNLDDAASVQVAEERGVWVGDSFSDRPEFGPDAYTTSVLFLWDPVYKAEIKAFLEGTWEGNRSEIWPLGVGSDLSPWGEKVPQDVIDQVEEVRQQMLNQGFNPFVGPLYDSKGVVRVAEGEELSAEFRRREWNWPVQGVVGMDEE
jgi:basic membrane protein A